MCRKIGIQFITILFALIGQQSFSQDEFFHEIALEKVLIENEKWEFIGEVDFKHIYDEVGWRRWGISLQSVRKIKHFRFLGGLNGYYTFDKSITNFFEVRPWLAIQHKLPLFSEISLVQRLKYEWRFFYTEGENSETEDYKRLRYQLGFDIPIPFKEESSWVIRPFIEWFFIRDPATFERFSNERDFGMLIIKHLKNEHEISFGYKIEAFFNQESDRGNGHIFLLAYSF